MAIKNSVIPSKEKCVHTHTLTHMHVYEGMKMSQVRD